MTGNNDDRLYKVERDTIQLQALFDKLDASVEKLTSISADVTQLLAVHENRLTVQERLHAQLESKADKRQDAIDERFGKIYDRIDEIKTEILSEVNENTGKISSLEKWMWTAFGGGSVIFFILDKLPFHL